MWSVIQDGIVLHVHSMLSTHSRKVRKVEEHEEECSSGRLLGAVQDFFVPGWPFTCARPGFRKGFHTFVETEWDPQKF